jgi:creatinine amidohydrolase
MLADLSWVQVAERLERDRRLIIPVGACDQHGPHLPIGTSTIIAEALADDLAREFDVLRAPTFAYGVNIPAPHAFPGAATLREKTLHRALNDLVADWLSEGFDEFILITAQEYDPHVDAIAAVAVEARVRVVDALAIDLSEFLEGEDCPLHGGELETSLLLYLRPDTVSMERAQDFRLDPRQYRRAHGGRLARIPEGCPGSVGWPTLATVEKGERIYAYLREKIREKVFLAPEPDAA